MKPKKKENIMKGGMIFVTKYAFLLSKSRDKQISLERNALVSRPSVYGILRLRSFHTWRKVATLIWKLLSEVLCDLSPGCNPNPLMACNILDNLLQSLEPSRFANASAMSRYRHHFRRSFAAIL